MDVFAQPLVMVYAFCLCLGGGGGELSQRVGLSAAARNFGCENATIIVPGVLDADQGGSTISRSSPG